MKHFSASRRCTWKGGQYHLQPSAEQIDLMKANFNIILHEKSSESSLKHPDMVILGRFLFEVLAPNGCLQFTNCFVLRPKHIPKLKATNHLCKVALWHIGQWAFMGASLCTIQSTVFFVHFMRHIYASVAILDGQLKSHLHWKYFIALAFDSFAFLLWLSFAHQLIWAVYPSLWGREGAHL